MKKPGALAALLIIAAPFAAVAQTHSQEDEAACTPDVMRLCQEYIPNRNNIIACMVEKKRELGPECFRVFSRPASSQRAVEDERRPRRKSGQHEPN